MSAREEFWRWFIQHEAELLDFEKDQDRIFDLLSSKLQKVNPDLTFEFGPRGIRREFVISAGGIKSSFPAAISLVGAAPQLAKWNVTAFRPRRTPLNTVSFRNKSIDPKDVQFSLLDNGTTTGLYLFMPNYREDDVDLKQIGYLLLDDALGEFDVETHLGLIKMFSLDANISLNRYPLVELPALFDQLVSRLSGGSGLTIS